MNVSLHTASLFLQGDEAAIAEVYQRYKALLFFIIATYVRRKEDCEDVYQNTFLKILDKRSAVLDPANLHAYLCATAKNEAIDFAKKNSSPYRDDDAFDNTPSAQESALDYFLPFDLSKEEKTIIGYKLTFGFTYQEIGEFLAMPVPTVKLRYKTAINKIKGAYRK